MEHDRTITRSSGAEDRLARTLARETAGPGEDEGTLAAGARLGRYVILGVLGQGGMGVVYAGHDPELDRRVALKLLLGADSSDAARLRLVREAQAMARLQHPNVVAVHDVGTVDDRVWVAMEHIEGLTLRAWLAQAGRSWRPVLAVLREAARGLGAAHAAGLIHRDVKPENIMIGRDGRVRVMDFGVARAGDGGAEPTGSAVTGASLLASELTRAGSLIGTPIYMAPEGLVGAPTDARADVFSWCVTCWEALHGERPFAGETLAELTHNVRAGRRRPPPARGVPAAVRRVLERGLEADPDRRYPTMEAVLVALDSIARRRRRGALAAGALLLSLGTAAALAGRHVQAAATQARCVAAGAAIAGVWSEDIARRVEASFMATGRADATEVFARTRPWLDAHASAWSAARTELCLASAARGATPLQEDGLACLEEQLAGLEALVDGVLARADAATLTRAVAAAARLPQVSRCADPTWLGRSPQRPADPDARARISRARIDLERAESLMRASKYDGARALATTVRADAEAIGWSPLIAEARLLDASLQVAAAEYAAAEAALEEVVWRAEAEGYDSLVAEAAHELTFAVGLGLGRPADGVRWGRLGIAVLHRLGESESLGATNNYAALGIVLESRGELDEAQALKEKVVALRERELGPDHPSVGSALNLMGVLHLERGDVEAARRAHERSLAIRLRTLGPEHVEVAASYINLGAVHQMRGDPALARALHDKSRRIFAANYGPDHPDVASAIEHMAACERALGDRTAALTHYRESLALRERALGPDHPQVGVSRLGVGELLLVEGDLAGADLELTRSLEIFERAHDREHPLVAAALPRLADLRARQGDPAGALALLERAHAIRSGRDLLPALAAMIDFKLGQALWERGDPASRVRARALIVAAAPTLLGEPQQAPADELQAVRAWLAAHEVEVTAAGAVLRPGG